MAQQQKALFGQALIVDVLTALGGIATKAQIIEELKRRGEMSPHYKAKENLTKAHRNHRVDWDEGRGVWVLGRE